MESTKKNYNTPNIETIILDNEISLALQSNPPFGPDETNNYQLNKPLFNPSAHNVFYV